MTESLRRRNTFDPG